MKINPSTAIKRPLIQAGFTLIEVLVSLSIFTVVVTISVGTLLVLIDANAKSQAMQVVMTNISFALDSMTREIRTGDSYYCAEGGNSNSRTVQLDNFARTNQNGNASNDCTNGSDHFAFREGGGSLTGSLGSNRIAYRLTVVDGNGIIERRLGSNTANWAAVTTPAVDINELEFVVTGSTAGDTVTPTVSIYISGQVVDSVGRSSAFDIQTTVSQLLLDI